MFNDYFNVQKLSIQQISEITGLNKGFLYKIRKRVQNIAYEICNTQIINLKRNIFGPSWAQSLRRGS